MSLRYQEPIEMSKNEFLKVIETAEIVPLCQAVVDVVHSVDDYEWLRDQFETLLEHPNENVRGVTATCIGHLARLHAAADREQLLSLLQPCLSDSSIRGQVEDAIDDIRRFAG